jgi:hypothetical protein
MAATITGARNTVRACERAGEISQGCMFRCYQHDFCGETFFASTDLWPEDHLSDWDDALHCRINENPSATNLIPKSLYFNKLSESLWHARRDPGKLTGPTNAGRTPSTVPGIQLGDARSIRWATMAVEVNSTASGSRQLLATGAFSLEALTALACGSPPAQATLRVDGPCLRRVRG